MSTANPVKAGLRQFLCVKDDKSQVLLSVRHPTKKELDAADLEYSASFNRALLAGLPTQTKMVRELRENEVISPADEQAISQLQQDLKVAEQKVRGASKALPEGTATSPDLEAAQAALAEVQRKLGARNREIDSMLAHTADKKAEDAQRAFLVACVVEYADGDKKGQRLWSSVDAFDGEQDAALLNRVGYEWMVLQADLPSEWDKLIAEVETEQKDPQADKSETNPAVQTAANAAAPAVDLGEPTVTVAS